MVRILAHLLFWLALSGCSVNMVALRTTSEILADATAEIETEENWQVFKDGVPAALKTIEGLAYLDPTNEDLLVSLTKGYAAYGFGVYETLHLEEKFKDADKTPYKRQAIYHYDKSISYGLRWLLSHGFEFAAFSKAAKADQGLAYLDDILDDDNQKHLEGVFFLGQSWLSYINLQRDQPALFAQLYVVKNFFDWVCKAKPDFRFGACQAFYGAYALSRPKMLGGDPEKGAAIFAKAIKDYPKNLFLRVAFLEYYAIAAMDEDVYKVQKRYLLAALKKTQAAKVPARGPLSLESPEQTGQIYNAIALRRFKIIRQYEKELF